MDPHQRDLRLARVLTAYAGLALADAMVGVTITLYAFSTGGATAAGLALGFIYLPAALAAPVIGDLGQGLSRGTRLSLGYAATAVLLVLLGGLVAVQASLVLIVALGAVVNVAVSSARPTHYAVLPQVASSAGALVRANSTTSFVLGVGNFVGPAISGIVAAAGLAWLSPVLGALALAGGSLLCARLGVPAWEHDEDDTDGAFARMRSVGRDSPVMVLLLLSSLSYLVVSALSVLSVAFAADVLGQGEAAQGLLVAAPAIGALVGAVVGAGLAYRRRLAPVFVLGVLSSGIVIAAVSLTSSLGSTAAMLAVVGLSGTVGGLAAETLVQRAVPDVVLLRVMAAWESLSVLGYTLGAFLAPVLVAFLGARSAFVPIGLAMALAAIVVLRRLRPLDDRAVFRTDVLARLRGVSFLSGLPPAGLDRVSRSADWLDVVEGDDVVVQGDAGDAYFVVDSGCCTVVVDGVHVHDLGPGDGFGEVALLFEVPRTATVTAAQEGRLLRVDRSDFLAALGRSPEGRRSAETVARGMLGEEDTV